jgi:ectoine hydroxylase-related dioxygenase (phytanoyl-CoA dioxygenase family)
MDHPEALTIRRTKLPIASSREASVTPGMLDTPYDIHSGLVEQLDREGFVRLKGVIAPDVLRNYEPAISDTVMANNRLHLPMEERSTYDRAFIQVDNLWRRNDVACEFVFSRRLARIAADLLGVDGVRLYHDQALYKEAGGGITPWHADQYYWPLAGDRCGTIWVPLQDTPLEMGPLAFAVGSHRENIARDFPIGDESERAVQTSLASLDLPTNEQPFALGDASFHMGWTFHRAGPNRAANQRKVMTIIYIDAEMTLSEPRNDNQRWDLQAWFPGRQPGDPADTELNPLLFDR